MDYKELRRKIEAFRLDNGRLGNQGYERVLLQLFGYTGHGKSSFINSCMYVLNDGGEFVEHAQAGQMLNGGSMTMIRKSFPLTSTITIVDNRGMRAMTEFERAEVYAQLGNFYPLDRKVEWIQYFNEAVSIIEDSEMDPNFSDFLVPIFIYSAQCVLGGEEEKIVKEFLRNCVDMTGVFPIIVITHKTSGNYQDAEKFFKLMGAEEVIGIENYTWENTEKTPERDIDVLRVLDKALDNVRFRLDLKRDPRAERIQRKTFLLNYFHQALVNEEERRIGPEKRYFTMLREFLERLESERENQREILMHLSRQPKPSQICTIL